jgi:hypothetical protein
MQKRGSCRPSLWQWTAIKEGLPSGTLQRDAGELVGVRVRAVIESMTGARFVHDTLEELGCRSLSASG